MSEAGIRPWVYLNGRFVGRDEATVPVLDRGFLFGDAVYEVLPVIGGQPFAAAQHLARLRRSLDALAIPCPFDEQSWETFLSELITRNGADDMKLYLQVTRGVAPTRDHRIDPALTPTVVAFCQELPRPDEAVLRDGVAAITAADLRWQRCDIKATSLLGNVLLGDLAVRAGANEVILFRDGELTEGASSNVFVVRDGLIATPPRSEYILGGITRELTLTHIHALGLAVREQTISRAEVESADEIWLTSATRDILPVTSLDGRAVGDGRPGPMWRRVLDAMREAV